MVQTQSFKSTKEGSILHITGNSGALVEDVSKYLKVLDHAYNSAYVFDSIIKQSEELNDKYNGNFPLPLRNLLWLNWWNPNEEKIASLVPVEHKLKLQKVNINSPGFWEFLGNLNPLQFIREYLKDNHERKKDRKYREEDEEKLGDLQVEFKRIEIIEKKIEIIKKLGVTDDDISVLKNELLSKPFKQLSTFQDTNLIIDAEIVDPNSESYISNVKSSNIPAPILSAARPFQAPSSVKEVRGKNLEKFLDALKKQEPNNTEIQGVEKRDTLNESDDLKEV
ncbi:MAG: hypothetical protein RMZ69_21490 [Nostoc sp. ChiQUE01a]|nr:hypothetical protein [Nostoc sp. ChiQUE01a]